MKEYLSDFIKNGKKYLEYLMKLGFKDLFVNFIEIIMLVILACLVYLPIGIISDLMFQIINIFVVNNVYFLKIYDLIFSLISAILAVYLFVYMFNKRYADIETLRKEVKVEINKTIVGENVKKIDEEFELPKKKKD